jgi:hypothetical protein
MTLLDTADAPLLQVKAPDLRWAITAVLPHAGTDDTLPVLTHVQVKVRPGVETDTAKPGRIILQATDRYSAARVEIHANTEQTFDGVIRGGYLKDLAAFLAREKGDVSLTLDSEHLTARPLWPGGFYEAPSRTYPIPSDAGTFPKIAPLMRAAADRTIDAATITGLNPAFLARFQHGQPYKHIHATVKGSTGPTPMVVAYGHPGDSRRFLGLLMPVRVEGAIDQFEGWDL